jgi:UDP-N-acetylmuramyl pentapeptide phosphotransferase/UDP-N-acetylglucosamine-1-phosphate transferase
MMIAADYLGRATIPSVVASFVLVGIVRQLAVRHGVIDHPGARSSHVVPTPRGGGLGLMLTVLALCAFEARRLDQRAVFAPLAGAALVALVGWLDDRRGLSVAVRLAAHVLSAMAVGIVAVSGQPTAVIAIMVLVWWTFWTVTSINLVNFMDGINGLVASQVAIFALSLALFAGTDGLPAYAALVVAAACIGFLPWNFPRARIFLGDVGSGGLGYLVPLLALLTMQDANVDFVRAHLPLFPLFGDAAWTIVRRWRAGERLTQPHRSHLYQRLANGGMGHVRVTALYSVAALVGAIAAHAEGISRPVVRVLIFAAATVLAGVVLDRRAGGSPHRLDVTQG